jgi:hypothetical protein
MADVFVANDDNKWLEPDNCRAVCFEGCNAMRVVWLEGGCMK